MASRRVLLIGVIVAVLIVVGIAYYVFVTRSGVRSSPSLSGNSGGSGPIRVVVLSVEKGVTAVKYKVAEASGVTTYTVFHIKNRLEGYLLRIKASIASIIRPSSMKANTNITAPAVLAVTLATRVEGASSTPFLYISMYGGWVALYTLYCALHECASDIYSCYSKHPSYEVPFLFLHLIY